MIAPLCARHIPQTDLAESIDTAVARDGFLDLRGTTFDQALATRVLSLAATCGVPIVLDESEIEGCLLIDGLTFHSVVSLAKISAKGGLSFRNCNFTQGLVMREALLGSKDGIWASSAPFVLLGTGPDEPSVRFWTCSFAGAVQFDSSDIVGPLGFVRCRFDDAVTFVGSKLEGDLAFAECEFNGRVQFNGIMSDRGRIWLEGLRFSQLFELNNCRLFDVNLAGVTFSGFANLEDLETHLLRLDGMTGVNVLMRRLKVHELSMLNARVIETINLEDATFFGRSYFGGSSLEGLVLSRATFEDEMFAEYATIGRLSFLNDITFHRNVTFKKAVFQENVTIGPLYVRGTMALDGVEFRSGARITIECTAVSFIDTRFLGAATLLVTGGTATLEGAEFSYPSLIAAWNDSLGPPEGVSTAPGLRVLSLRRANVRGLRLEDVDMRECELVGSHNLDGLRVGGGITWPSTPRRVSWAWPCFWTRRIAIREEQMFRMPIRKGQPVADVGSRGQTDYRDPFAVASVYRALRKGLEDERDVPGAADFYYGEMEMRRISCRRWPMAPERILLTLYWMFSGYGLRGSRSVAALLVLVVSSAAVNVLFGIERVGGSAPSVSTALLFSVESGLGLSTSDSIHPTSAGEWMIIVTRLVGAALLALAVLAVRNRVRR